ncbi:MAG: NepR family anti-sigma factor [bacterium]|nr:NepR family anti-sigma factor [bacterium]
MTERNATAGGADADTDTPPPGKKVAQPVRKRRSAASQSQDDGHVAQALRTVYQRAVAEDIPLEMLDLLSKLD